MFKTIIPIIHKYDLLDMYSLSHHLPFPGITIMVTFVDLVMQDILYMVMQDRLSIHGVCRAHSSHT